MEEEISDKLINIANMTIIVDDSDEEDQEVEEEGPFTHFEGLYTHTDTYTYTRTNTHKHTH